jgi:hypothetical protein
MNKRLCRFSLVVLLTGLTGLLYAGDVAVLMSSDAEVYQAALDGFRETSRHRIVSEYNMKKILPHSETSWPKFGQPTNLTLF